MAQIRIDPSYMGGCQNYGPFLNTLNIRCRIIVGIQKGTMILTTTRMMLQPNGDADITTVSPLDNSPTRNLKPHTVYIPEILMSFVREL